MIRVILHERGAAGQADGHDFHRPQQRRRLPIAFRAKAVAICHKALGGNAGKLGQPVQILERGGEALEIARPQKRAQAEFDAGGFAHGIVPGAALAQISKIGRASCRERV